jgi:hypothetical protein
MLWKQVNDDLIARLSKEGVQESKGIQFTVMMSPYAIPEAIKGEFNNEHKVFEIRFRYMDEEKAETKKIDQHVSILVGVNSGRLMGIDVDILKLDVSVVSLALKEFEKTVPEKQRRNFEAAREVLLSKAEELCAV